MAWDIVEKEQFALGAGTPFVYRTIFITEFVARDLAKKYQSKNTLENELIKIAKRPLEERAYANYWANPGSSFEGKNYSLEQHKAKIRESEKGQISNIPNWLSWSGKSEIETVPVMINNKTAIIVTGDANRNKVLTVPGGGFATVKIELPNNWNKLMDELGYKPLSNYYLETTNIYLTPENNSQKTETFHEQNPNRLRNRNSSQNQNRRPSPERYRQILEERKSSSSTRRRNRQ